MGKKKRKDTSSPTSNRNANTRESVSSVLSNNNDTFDTSGNLGQLQNIGQMINLESPSQNPSRYSLPALHQAVKSKNVIALKSLIALGADVDAIDTVTGETALHVATELNSIDCAKVLLGENQEKVTHKKSNVNIVDINGRTPLFIAVTCNDWEMCELLIKHGANPHDKDSTGKTLLHQAVIYLLDHSFVDFVYIIETLKCDVNAVDHSGMTPLHYVLDRIKNTDTDTLLSKKYMLKLQSTARTLIRLGTNLEVIHQDGLTLLHLAIVEGVEEIVWAMLTRVKHINIVDANQITLFECAVQHKQWATILTLFEKIRDDDDAINQYLDQYGKIDQVDDQGNTLLYYAVKNNYVNVIKKLLARGANVNHANKEHDRPIAAAITFYNDTTYILELLLKHLPEEFRDFTKGKNANDPLRLFHVALLSDSHMAVEKLCEFYSVNTKLYLESVNDYTYPIHFACKLNLEKIIKTIIKNKCQFDLIDSAGDTAIHWAYQTCNENILQLISEHYGSLNAKDEDGQTILHRAVCSEHNLEKLKKFIDNHSLNIDLLDDFQKTALHYAIDTKADDNALYLISKGADLNIILQGLPILHYAISGNASHKVITALLDKIDNINCKDDMGNTGLHLAILNDREDIIPALFEKNADVYQEDDANITPLVTALTKQDRKYLMLLKKHGVDLCKRSEPGQFNLLDFVILSENEDLVSCLLTAGASATLPSELPIYEGSTGIFRELYDFLPEKDKYPDKIMITPLQLATFRGNKKIIELIKQYLPKEEIKPYSDLLKELDKFTNKFEGKPCAITEINGVINISLMVDPGIQSQLYNYLKNALPQKKGNKKSWLTVTLNKNVIQIESDNPNLLKFTKSIGIVGKELGSILDKSISKEKPVKITGAITTTSTTATSGTTTTNGTTTKSAKDEKKPVVLTDLERSNWEKSIATAFAYAQEVTVTFANNIFEVTLPKANTGTVVLTMRAPDAEYQQYTRYHFPASFVEKNIISRIQTFLAQGFAQIERKDNKLLITPTTNLSPDNRQTKDLHVQLHKQFASNATLSQPVKMKLEAKSEGSPLTSTYGQGIKSNTQSFTFYKPEYHTKNSNEASKSDKPTAARNDSPKATKQIETKNDVIPSSKQEEDLVTQKQITDIRELICNIMDIDKGKLNHLLCVKKDNKDVFKFTFNSDGFKSLSLRWTNGPVGMEHVLSALENTLNSHFSDKKANTMNHYSLEPPIVTLVLRNMNANFTEISAKAALLAVDFQYELNNLIQMSGQANQATTTLFKPYHKAKSTENLDTDSKDEAKQLTDNDVSKNSTGKKSITKGTVNCEQVIRTLKPHYRKHLEEHLELLDAIMKVDKMTNTHVNAALLHMMRIFTILAKNDASGVLYNWRNITRHCYAELNLQAFTDMIKQMVGLLAQMRPFLKTNLQSVTFGDFMPAPEMSALNDGINAHLVQGLEHYETKLQNARIAKDSKINHKKQKIQSKLEIDQERWNQLIALGTEVSENKDNVDPAIKNDALLMIYSSLYELDDTQLNLRPLYGRIGHEFSNVSYRDFSRELLANLNDKLVSQIG